MFTRVFCIIIFLVLYNSFQYNSIISLCISSTFNVRSYFSKSLDAMFPVVTSERTSDPVSVSQTLT